MYFTKRVNGKRPRAVTKDFGMAILFLFYGTFQVTTSRSWVGALGMFRDLQRNTHGVKKMTPFLHLWYIIWCFGENLVFPSQFSGQNPYSPDGLAAPILVKLRVCTRAGLRGPVIIFQTPSKWLWLLAKLGQNTTRTILHVSSHVFFREKAFC